MKKLFLTIAIIATFSTNFAWGWASCGSIGWAQQCESHDGGMVYSPYYYVTEYVTIYVNSQITNSGTTWANFSNNGSYGGNFGHYYNMSGTSYDSGTIYSGMGGGDLMLFAHTIGDDTDAVITANW